MSDNTGASNTASGAAAGIGAIAAMGGIMGTMSETIKNGGGSDIAKSISNALPERTKDYFNETTEKIFNRDQFRSPTIFFGIGEETAFYFERTPSLIVERLQHNISFFYMNYLLLTAILFALTLLISPSALIGIAFLAVAWVSVIRATKDGAFTFQGVSLSQKHASLAMTVVSGLVLFWLLKSIFWWTLGSSGVLVGAHSFFRDASMHKDEEDKIQMTGDIGPGSEDEFLNPPSQINSV